MYVANRLQPNQILFNDKKGGFVEVLSGPAVSGIQNSVAAVAFEHSVNADGFVDLYVVNSGQPNQLFLSDSRKEGGFVEVTRGPAVGGGQTSLGAVAIDANTDGKLDLYVTNWGQPNQLFIADSGAAGGFAEVLSGPAVRGSQYSVTPVAARPASSGPLRLLRTRAPCSPLLRLAPILRSLPARVRRRCLGRSKYGARKPLCACKRMHGCANTAFCVRATSTTMACKICMSRTIRSRTSSS